MLVVKNFSRLSGIPSPPHPFWINSYTHSESSPCLPAAIMGWRTTYSSPRWGKTPQILPMMLLSHQSPFPPNAALNSKASWAGSQ